MLPYSTENGVHLANGRSSLYEWHDFIFTLDYAFIYVLYHLADSVLSSSFFPLSLCFPSVANFIILIN